MGTTGNITIIEPINRFKKVDISLIENENIDCTTLGVYTKLIVLGKKWNLNVKGLRKHLGLSDDKVRKSLSLLEQEGYIVRTPCRNDKGQLIGWNYAIYPTPVNEEERSQAGKSKLDPDDINPTTPKTDNSDCGGLLNNRLNQQIDLNKQKEERDKSLSKKKTEFNVRADLSYVNAEFSDIWNEWLDYKDAINKQYKTQKGANMQYSSMIRMSDNNPVLANAIIKRSIEMSWDGLSSLTDKQKKFFLSDRSPYNSNDIGGKPEIKPSLPDGWTQERYDMLIRNGYTITPEGRVFKDGKEYK